MLKKPRAREYFSIKYCFAGEEEKIPHVLDSYVKNQLDLSDVNRVLELSNIKQFFDKYDHVNGWSDDCYLKNKELSRNVEKEVKSFFLSISENKIVSIYDACEVMFWDEFWKYFYIYKVYEKISMEHFKEIAEGLHMSPNKLLENKNLVEKFDVQITEMLKTPEFGARFIVDFYLRKDNGKIKYYLPKGLTREDKYNTVKAYINGDIVNANILDLIMNGKSKNPKEFEVDVKLKHLAKKRYERYWDENTMPVIKHETGINVSFSPENPDCEVVFSAGVITAKYNSNWIKDNLDYPTLLNNFIYLFAYTDGYMRCSLTAGSLKQGIIENLFSTQGNGMYQKGQSFELLNALSNVQMHGYVGVLNSCDIYLEDIIKWFFEVYIKNEFGANGFICNMPEKSDSILSKYERVATVMDGETKQFKLFCEEGEIDRELYEMISGSVRYKEIPSLIKNKYAYANSNEIVREMAKEFSSRGIPSVAVFSYASGEYTEKRNVAIQKLKNGEIKVIFSVDMFNEGVDITSVDMVMFLRPTESPIVFLQQLGRGLRKYRGKEFLTVLDFIGNYEKAGRVRFLLEGKTDVQREGVHLSDALQFPDDCLVDFDMKLIDLFAKMYRKHLKLKDQIINEYFRVKELLGKRPTRLDLFTYMDDNIYESAITHSKDNPFKRYLEFLNDLGELSQIEEEFYKGIGREFISLIENTNMSKV